ncbi:cell division protein ZapE [Polymorphobacter fuscus]|uniref:Cell division protein ZapE n=1 Tax=Sandarakinorhabdus fusca TaxID=1439888 RepID=A0A7C9KKU8_9SPHN|nr:cell division protein ZapE [Polymorphobacter fuscus]KAB7648351.1 cell division protein ZapE [Polymorphobacter fuscus]MQT15864.1 cell division protein ZapE [Polymorphobacter fuscus]NJC07863.1 cell division protein ZapE [Polymorphobacter fuscus]
MAGVRAAYDALVAAGELRPDAAQAAVADRLQALAEALEKPAAKPGFFARITGAAAAVAPRGLYIWGGVGRGKSMIMDLFYGAVDVVPKRRVHFHEFMLEVHADIFAERQRGGGDPIPAVAATIAASARLLAFDEMQVKDIADAAIVSRLFTALFAHGVTVVATSNRVPEDLYKDGLNRQLFTPFIVLLRGYCDVVTLDGPVDYRLERLGGAATWHVPNGPAATAALAETFFRMTDYPVEDRARVPTETLAVPGGRTLFVPKSLKGVAVFSFSRLCRQPLGAADYLAIARHFHTLFLVGVPMMGPENRNEAARFVTLIDALYEHKVKLLASADAVPAGLYPTGDGAFEFARTVSRLMEMQSADYLALGHG